MKDQRSHHPLCTTRSLLFALASLGLALTGCERPSAASSNAPMRAGQPAPALSAVDAQGRPIDLATFAGKIVLVDFWASWCEPCQEAMPGLDQLAADYADQVVVIGVSVDEDPEQARAFVERVGVGFPIVHDADHSIAARWVPPKMPTTFVIDPAGDIVEVHGGYNSASLTELRAQIERIQN
ncbi:Thiol-disulfide oxidoreductase ResA [Enhygromyxa salina]|uniref:Thiol-disulfide oxidoreductase ResA n=1 Tax=Enhygromyxa salina TaxID=215803 RepID=A0A2S9XCW6_9BACT|nr:TlpA disulfide reductase family protein [Enhygromyxa salina]PRP90640.1 Thiol-disulfide oxidoreductase ResA [Enhygromyxa salina]